MKNKKSGSKYILLSIFLIATIVGAIGFIVTALIAIAHALKNPDLTMTQNFLWYWKQYKAWIIIPNVGYIGLLIFGNK